MNSEGTSTGMLDSSLQPSPINRNPEPQLTVLEPEKNINLDISSAPPSPINQNHEPQRLPPQHRHNMQTHSKIQIVKPKTKLSLTIRNTPFIPTSLNKALQDEKWLNSMCDEFNVVTRNCTFVLVPTKPNQNVIETKWIYTIKYLSNGVVDRRKSGLVARGYDQRYGLDYAETYSPVIKSTTVCVVLEQIVRLDWPILQLNVNNVFLQGTLEDEVFVSQPQGFVDKDRPHHVCRLKKALYDLKQLPSMV